MTPDAKPLGSLKPRLMLGAASVTVLAIGLAIAPEPSERTERPREAPAPILLRELAIERAHKQITTSVQRAAADARQYVVSVDQRGLGLAVDTA